MNYKNIISLFAIVAFMLVAFTSEGLCNARASASTWNSCYAHTYAKCKGLGGRKKQDCTRSGACPKECYSKVSCWTSHARAWARGECQGNTAIAKAFATARGWYYAKASSEEIDTNFIAIDTTTVEMNAVGSNVEFSLRGNMNAVPMTASRLTVEVFQNADENDVIFTGKAVVNGNFGELEVTGFDPGNFSVTPSGDTTKVEFDFSHDPIPYSGSADSLGIILIADPMAGVEVPALSQYALIILVILVVGSGIWLMLRKRRAMIA